MFVWSFYDSPCSSVIPTLVTSYPVWRSFPPVWPSRWGRTAWTYFLPCRVQRNSIGTRQGSGMDGLGARSTDRGWQYWSELIDGNRIVKVKSWSLKLMIFWEQRHLISDQVEDIFVNLNFNFNHLAFLGGSRSKVTFWGDNSLSGFHHLECWGVVRVKYEEGWGPWCQRWMDWVGGCIRRHFKNRFGNEWMNLAL